MAEKNLNLSLLLEFYGGMLTPRQREMADYSYNDDLSLSEIAEICGITRQGVWDGLHKTEAILRDAEEKLGLYKNYKKRAETVDFVLARLRAIEGTDEIVKALEEMPLG